MAFATRTLYLLPWRASPTSLFGQVKQTTALIPRKVRPILLDAPTQGYATLITRITRRSVANRPQSRAKEPANAVGEAAAPKAEKSLGIFKRFKEAYKQHGTVLIFCHILTSFGWIGGFFLLSKNGYDVTKVLDALEKVRVISRDTRTLIMDKIEHFNLENFLKNYHFDYVFSEKTINWFGETLSANVLKNVLSAVMLYKLFTPLRYLLTLTVTKLSISMFKRQGIIPMQPPPGYSIKEMYSEQKILYQRRIRNQRERYNKTKLKLFSKGSFLNSRFENGGGRASNSKKFK